MSHPGASGTVRPSGSAARELAAQRAALHRYVSSLVAPDHHRAEDIVQETLLRAWQHSDHLDWTGRPIRMWLFRTARNLVIDAWRKERTVATGLTPEQLYDAAAPGTAVADDVSDRAVLVAGLRRLAPAQREILVHVHVLGRPTDDIARTLGIPAGTVKSRTHHAVRALRRALDPAA